MSLGDFRLLYGVSCVFLGLTIVFPTLALVMRLPGGERFSELYILGPGRMAEDYPFNVEAGVAYSVFLGVANRMGSFEHYLVYAKLRNQTEALPNSTIGVPSGLAPLFEFHVFLENGRSWEKSVLFSFKDVSFTGNVSSVSAFIVDGVVVNVGKTAVWSEQSRGFYCQLFFELWRYNATASVFQYHDRFVGIWLNVTRAA